MTLAELKERLLNKFSIIAEGVGFSQGDAFGRTHYVIDLSFNHL
jgi:hypothetical protein